MNVPDSEKVDLNNYSVTVMFEIRAKNANMALPLVLRTLRMVGVKRNSRNGPVVMLPEPACIVYTNPCERVLFWPQRDANPFFHLMESLWMLAGRKDVEFVAKFVKRMRDYSDDGTSFNGAYGYRWRNHFDRDQLPQIADALKENPDCRRQVLGIWDPRHDLGLPSKDLPCNTHVYFSRGVEGELNMTVMNRSNDAVWGAVGANVVHFSVLQEYMAARIGCAIGTYYQISNNLHLYLEKGEGLMNVLGSIPVEHIPIVDLYAQQKVTNYPMFQSCTISDWEGELTMFLEEPNAIGFRVPFFRHVAIPFARAHELFRTLKAPDKYHLAIEALHRCKASDWKLAGEQWLEARLRKWELAQDNGPDYES